MDDIDTKAFLKEREDKLGSKIIWRTYATFFAQLGKEKRNYGVFVYSDGDTINIEDFERVPAIFGIALSSRRKKDEYVKLEISFKIDDIESIRLVTRHSADLSCSKGQDLAKSPSFLGAFFRKLVTEVKMKDGSIFFFELMSHKEFKTWAKNINKEIE